MLSICGVFTPSLPLAASKNEKDATGIPATRDGSARRQTLAVRNILSHDRPKKTNKQHETITPCSHDERRTFHVRVRR